MLPVTATLAERHTGEKEIKQEVRVGSGPRIASPDSTTAFKETATRSRFTTDRLLRQFRDQFEEFFFASYFQLSTPSRKCFLHLWVQMSRMRLFQHFCSDSPRWRCSMSRRCGRGSSYCCFDTASVPDQRGHCSSTTSCSETSHFLISPLPMEPLCSS